jgi:S1-C subfamily serine protease
MKKSKTNKMKTIIPYLLFLFIFSSCATMFTGSVDYITFNSSPSNADVYIDSKPIGKTPVTSPIDRKIRPVEVKVVLEQNRQEVFYLNKSFNPSYALNLFTPFGIGIFVDLANGNAVRYSDKSYYTNFYDNNDNGNRQVAKSTNESGKRILSSGTGFLIAKGGFVATNYHVVEKGSEFVLYFPKDNLFLAYKAFVVAKDQSNDLAILEIVEDTFSLVPPYALEDKYEVGEEVFTIGYPAISIQGTDFKMTKGEINSLSGIQNNKSWLQHSAAIQPGNSGGPLFNKEGNIIGVTNASINDEAFLRQTGSLSHGIFYAIKSDYLKVLTNNLKNYNPTQENKSLKHMDFKDQIKILKDYVCIIFAYE